MMRNSIIKEREHYADKAVELILGNVKIIIYCKIENKCEKCI